MKLGKYETMTQLEPYDPKNYSKDKYMDLKTQKIESGKKYARLTQFQTLQPWQQALLRDITENPYVNLPSTANQGTYQQGNQFLQGLLSQNPEMMAQFEAPAMRQFNEQIVPGIAERFTALGGRNSGAFNQAMGQASTDLAERLQALRSGLGLQAAQTGLSYAQVPYQEALGQQGLGLSRAQLALGTQPFGYLNVAPRTDKGGGVSNFFQGMAPGIGQGAGAAAMFALMSAMSSEKVKTNIRDYNKGLDVVKNLDVKIYDYKPEVGGAKNKVGVIAETVPDEIQVDLNGIKGVDLYGLISLLINSVKGLNDRIEKLETK